MLTESLKKRKDYGMSEQNLEQLERPEQIYKFDPPPDKKKKRRRGIIIWLIVLACILAFGTIISYSFKAAFPSVVTAAPSEPYVGVLYVEGVIAPDNVDSWGRAIGYQHVFTLDAIDEMIDDTNNMAIILYVDSPGGGVYESDELYYKIKEYQETTGRPVFSYMASMAASGGYYISAPADMIFANRNCWTGSIGVTIGTFFDLSGFLNEYGVKTVTIASDKNKSMGSLVDPLTQEQKGIFQSLVDEAYEQFVSIVAEGRSMDTNQVKRLADGRIYTAYQALDADLIDVVSTYDEFIAYIAEHYELEGVLLHDFLYHDSSFMGILLSSIPLPQLPKSEAEIVLSLVKNDMVFPISYMTEILSD
ncbi:hypothetical protein MASR2M70_20560 [Bacillota bacterium]